MHTLAAAVLTCFAVLGATFAAAAQERWAATSTTAQSVTGSVIFNSHLITFQNAPSLTLEALSTIPDITISGVRGPATTYRVTAAENATLRRGNFLCGREPVTHILVVAHSQTRGRPARSLSVFEGASIPDAMTSPCAIYNYELVSGRMTSQVPSSPAQRGAASRQVVSSQGNIRPTASAEVPADLQEIGWDTDLPGLLVIRYLPQRTSFEAGWSGWALQSYFHFTGATRQSQPDPWPPFFTERARGRYLSQLNPSEMQAFQEWCFRRAAVVPHVIVHSIPYAAPPRAQYGVRVLPLGFLPNTPLEEQTVEGVGFAMVIMLAVQRSADEYAVEIPGEVIRGLPTGGLRLETRVKWTEPRRLNGYLTFGEEPISVRIVREGRVLWEHLY